MAASADFLAFVQEQLEPLHGLLLRRMFGGAGLSVLGHTFGLIIDNTLYFKVDDQSRPQYEGMGSHFFSYTTRLRQVDVKSYYAVPADLLEERERLLGMARQALAVAERAPAPAPKAKPKARTAPEAKARPKAKPKPKATAIARPRTQAARKTS